MREKEEQGRFKDKELLYIAPGRHKKEEVRFYGYLYEGKPRLELRYWAIFEGVEEMTATRKAFPLDPATANELIKGLNATKKWLEKSRLQKAA